VHRFTLGASSHCFDRAFGAGATSLFVEPNHQESKIALSRLATQAFEAMLDYCYSLSSNQTVANINNAAGLLFLSDYFQRVGSTDNC
jgi:hypothetical protein